ncbi:hypothetical protein MAR_031211 [Mya arenaria]|uniref:Uncharacterized protein n=1 Tax=Mya arenaria TaxID=6604 RepID=A0ABY7F6H8_MYAAR|nr:hypothetical protein MAR_031211 [Mya arenaria]
MDQNLAGGDVGGKKAPVTPKGADGYESSSTEEEYEQASEEFSADVLEQISQASHEYDKLQVFNQSMCLIYTDENDILQVEKNVVAEFETIALPMVVNSNVHDLKIFTLVTLLCNVLIYNMQGVFDRQALETWMNEARFKYECLQMEQQSEREFAARREQILLEEISHIAKNINMREREKMCERAKKANEENAKMCWLM